ncbi:ribonuclease J [Candidatus Gracilibacteria bacterium]|nr:ribonuclease J [Candidatus Gracilibacteria bacterium]
MKDFLDELDIEVRDITAKTEVPVVKNIKAEDKKPTAEKTGEQKPAHKKPVHNHKATGGRKSGGARPQHAKNNNRGQRTQGSSSSAERKQHKYGRKTLEFPDTKFFLPSLREGYTRYIPVGGNNEIGAKNMSMVQYGEDILLIDCGIQFAEPDMYGADYSVPDVSFLKKYTKNIKGFLITHAHLDHIGCLKDVLPVLDMPTLYGTKLTIGLIKKSIQEAGLMPYATFVEIDAGVENKTKIGQFDVEFFSVNHSIPDCAGLLIETPGGARFVHTGDFKIDHTPRLDKPADFERYEEIGKKGVTMLLSDSTGSTTKGFSMSEKEVGDELEKIVSEHTGGRLIIAAFSSWISRVQQLVDIAEKYDKYIYLSGRSMTENIAIAQKLGYITMKPGTIKKLTPKNTAQTPANKQIIITTGSQGEEYSALSRMSDGKHPAMSIQAGDTVVFSSSVVPGNERSVSLVINKLIKYGVKIITKADRPVHTSGHGYQEEQKIFIRLFKPKYFMPIYGDLYFRTRHSETAMSVGIKESNILMLDNGNIIDFAPNGSVFRSKIKVPLQEYIVDGYGMGLMGSHVLQAREQMMNSGVMVVHYKVDKKSKAILGHIKLETRGLVYVEEVRYIHRILIKKAREAYENTVKDVPDMEEKDLIKIIRTDLENFLLKRIDREPMIIPMITEV